MLARAFPAIRGTPLTCAADRCCAERGALDRHMAHVQPHRKSRLVRPLHESLLAPMRCPAARALPRPPRDSSRRLDANRAARRLAS
eukprot:3210987-Prymnesium_polylepis.1